ncbi:MAG TPA: hypothetical protein VFU21_03640 [Kofleriaceae bacterium]|nr:hypothetical protein [Kofleriaceae bacterium]
MRAIAIAALAGCTAAGSPAEAPDAGLSNAELEGGCTVPPVAVDTAAPIFLFYGAYQPNPGETPRADAASTLSLLGTGEPVLALRRAAVCAATDPELQPWQAGGGKVAHVMSEDELMPRLADGTAAAVIGRLLHQGYAYVAVDELHAQLAAMRDGNWGAATFAGLLADLAAAGLDRRLILYVNSYNLPGQLHTFRQVLSACGDHCRIVASEVYLHTQHVFAPGAEEPGHCNRSTDCFERLAIEMGTAAPGINHRAITVLAVSDEFNQRRADSLCERPGGLAGGLHIQYARLHAGSITRLQPGVGAYTPARVDRRLHMAWGPAEQAACLRRLNGWAYWPAAH